MYFIPEWTRDIHHISYDDVRNEPYFPEVWDSLVMPFINQTPDIPLFARNGTTFDMNAIRDCCNYFEMKIPKLQYFDSLFVARKTWPELNHHLTALGEHFKIVYEAHDALEDSRTCGLIINLAAKYHNVNTVSDLLEKCNLQIQNL